MLPKYNELFNAPLIWNSMNYRILPHAGKPAYLQLYEQLRTDIVRGTFPYGQKAPSKRLLAEELRISLATVEHAYALLCEEGYIESRQRSGYFVCLERDDLFSEPASAIQVVQAPTYVQTAQEFPYSVLSHTMRAVLNEYGKGLLVKTANSGCIELRSALSGYLSRSRGIDAEPEQIIIGSGAEYLYGLLVKMLGRDRIYGLENPSYAKIREVYQAEGATCEMLPLGMNGISSAALAQTGASVLHITPYRSYPSGVTATASKRHEYLQWASQSGRLLIEDDFESEFSVSGKPEEPLFALAERHSQANVIYLNTFSRTISSSLRVGYMVLPEELLPLYEQKVGFYSCTVPAFEQYLLAKLISSGDFERHINRVRRAARRQAEQEKGKR